MPAVIKNKRGFTLIELLVVISIIGFLSTLAIVSLKNARTKARDARRLSDIRQLEKAIQLYYDNNNKYPPITYAYTYTANNPDCGRYWCTLETALAPYMPSGIPRDPSGLQTVYRYFYEANKNDGYQTYGMMIRFESSGNSSLATGDNGFYSGYFEIGSQPPYCADKGKNWLNTVDYVCAGID